MIPLLLGIVLAIGALGFVLWPLFREPVPDSRGAVKPEPAAGAGQADSETELAIDALREVEFDRATGKLSDSDYAVLKERYTGEALAAMRAEEGATGSTAGVSSDDIEALISRFRTKAAACSSCGPRPEPDAVYCSNCGRFLGGACSKCGAAVIEPGARFCSSCGAVLAA